MQLNILRQQPVACSSVPRLTPSRCSFSRVQVRAEHPRVQINEIPNNGKDAGRSQDGIPPVMGAHLMPSGAVAPISVSKGPGMDVTPHQFQVSVRPGANYQMRQEKDRARAHAERQCMSTYTHRHTHTNGGTNIHIFTRTNT